MEDAPFLNRPEPRTLPSTHTHTGGLSKTARRAARVARRRRSMATRPMRSLLTRPERRRKRTTVMMSLAPSRGVRAEVKGQGGCARGGCMGCRNTNVGQVRQGFYAEGEGSGFESGSGGEGRRRLPPPQPACTPFLTTHGTGVSAIPTLLAQPCPLTNDPTTTP